MSKTHGDTTNHLLSRIPTDKEIPEQLGKYLLQKEIGRGTCGVVYRAYDPFVNRDVAIKLALSDTSFDPSSSLQENREFFAEAHAAGMLHHPHIVSVFDAGIVDGFSYIVMEYVDGDTLARYTKASGKNLTVNQIVDVVFKCAKALDYSHKRGVLHRDIKPSNIMLTDDGVAKIMDFSIAEMLQGNSRVKPESIMGSPAYMAPEQLRRQELGPTADLYSLGAVMYHLFANEPPYSAADMRGLFELVKYAPPPRLAERRPDLPEVLTLVCDRLLSKDPDLRFQSGGDLAIQLTRIYNQLSFADRQISRSENRDSLRNLRFFAEFEEGEIDEILSASTMLTFHAGDTIIREGDIDNAFYIIAVGRATVKKGAKEMMPLGKGDVFGEIGFLTAAKRTASVVAVTEVLALKVNAVSMEQVSQACQLRYYKVFCETLIYRLSMTSAKLSAQR